MGTWGVAIANDDTVADVVEFVVERLKVGVAIHVASDQAQSHFADLLSTPEDAATFWFALAHVQWKYGEVDAAIIARVCEAVANAEGLDAYRGDAALLAKRITALNAFCTQIATANPRPASPPKRISRLAPYASGDCLAIAVDGGRFGAALVVGVDNSQVEVGMNRVAVLDYWRGLPPTLDAFTARPWLWLWLAAQNAFDIRWYLPARFRTARKNFVLVGNIGSSRVAPESDAVYTAWTNLGVLSHLSSNNGL